GQQPGWTSAARDALVKATRQNFIRRVRVSRRECESIMRLLQSQLGFACPRSKPSARASWVVVLSPERNDVRQVAHMSAADAYCPDTSLLRVPACSNGTRNRCIDRCRNRAVRRSVGTPREDVWNGYLQCACRLASRLRPALSLVGQPRARATS